MSKWKRKDIILFLERFELYISAGMTINHALQSLEQGMRSKQKSVMRQIREKVESGELLSQALSIYMLGDKTTSSLIAHGEASGRLSQSLVLGKSLLEKEDELLRKCLSALSYPLVIGLFASLLTIGLVRGVMPQIIPMLKSLHVQLPLLTRIVISISDILLSYGIYIGIAIVLIITVSIILYRRIIFIRRLIHGILLHIPIVGHLIQCFTLSVFLRSCGTLIESGLSSLVAYKRTVGVIVILPLRIQFQDEIPNLNRGLSFGQIFTDKKLPSHIAPLLLAGEASGNLGNSLIRCAHILDHDIDHILKRLTALIEPILMAGMGCVVGAIALSIMLPIYDISRVLQK